MSMFKKATKAQSKLRLALIGVSGAGKTYSALRIASGLGRKIALIDTERGSASKYADEICEFDVLELERFPPAEYVKAIRMAEKEGYDVLVIDSLSHAWSGQGGALEMVDEAAARSRSKNTFAAWRDVTPEHNALVDAILRSRMHVIATMRAKTEYVLESGPNGTKTPNKIGMAPVQRDGMEYEFDVIGDIDLEHKLIISKSRCAALDKKVFRNPGEDVAALLRAWLSDGAPVSEQSRPQEADARPFAGAPPGAPTATQPASSQPGSQTSPTNTTVSTTDARAADPMANSLADELVDKLYETTSRAAFDTLVARAQNAWASFKKDEKLAIKGAREHAEKRIVELEHMQNEQRREAEEAERALGGAQETDSADARDADDLGARAAASHADVSEAVQQES